MTHNILIACLYLGVFFFLQRALKNAVQTLADKKQVSAARTSLVTRFISYLLFFVTLSLMAVSLGLGYQEVSLFVSSAFAVLGVALVAQWSILSNLTAGVLIFLCFPTKSVSGSKSSTRMKILPGYCWKWGCSTCLSAATTAILLPTPTT